MLSKNKTIKQPGFQIAWESQETNSTDLDDGFHCMRDWQIEAFTDLKNDPHMIINAPMGSGKSWMICLLSAYKLIKNSNLRCIICVPQTIIAPGFANAKLQLPDESKIHWLPANNLCNKENKSTTNYVIKWLKKNLDSFNNRILLCTHATLVSTFKKLNQENRLDLFLNLLCWIDEAHHVKNCIAKGSNSIGTVISHLINNSSNNTEIGLTTATFFRGDQSSLLMPDQEELFKRFNLPYDKYLKSLKYLKSFSFDFILCGQDYTKAVEILIKNRKSKDIIYIPHPMSRHSSGKKLKEVQDIIKLYQKEHGGEIIESSDGLTLIKNETSTFKILDLVSEDRRNEKKMFLESNQLKNDRDHLDVIIALGMFKEGANWIWAERSIIAGARDSLVDIIQMMGRLFRDAKDKEHVEVIQLLPFSLDQHADDFQDNLNNYLKAIFSLLILENILKPVKINISSEKNITKNNNSNPLNDLVPNETKQKAIFLDVTHHLIKMRANPLNKDKSITTLRDEFQKDLPFILKKHNITKQKDIEKIGCQVWNMLLRQTLKMQGIDVENIDFNIIQNTDPIEGLLRYTSTACGIDTFVQLRKAIQANSDEYEARWYSNYELVKKDSKQNGHCKFPKNYEIKVNKQKIKLGSWFNDQKKNFNNLPKSKQELLENLPGFILNKFKRNINLSIDEWINLFIKECQKSQTPLIPNSYEVKDYKLGQWIQHIRKPKEWKKLSTKQKTRLLNNNFKLSPKTEWNEAAILALYQFANREKHTYPKTGTKETIIHKEIKYYIRLDNFCNNIRKNTDQIDPWIINDCKTIPFFSLERKEVNKIDNTYFEKGFESFKNHIEKKLTPIFYGQKKKDYPELSKWQKYVIKKDNKIDQKFKLKILALNPYFFLDHMSQIFFHEIKPLIEKYMQENNDAIIPQNYITSNGIPLGEKISNLRGNKNKTKKSIREYLDSLGNKWAWNYFEYKNIENIKKMISYFENNVFNFQKLPPKIQTLRLKIKKTISKNSSLEKYKNRIEELAPGIFDEPIDENYQELLNYLKREGHACPPIKHLENGKKIGYYVSNIRQKYKKANKDGLEFKDKTKFTSLTGWKWKA
jgi:superfamily II DNA or RNA helicase